MKKPLIFPGILSLVVAGVFAALHLRHGESRHNVSRVFAATGSFPAAQYLQTTDGGMAQYGYALQQSSSPSATLQALAEWNSYISVRSEWSMPSTLVSRLATADWNARAAGSPSITAEQLANAATSLINARLATITASEQKNLFRQMMVEVTPKGNLGLNDYSPYVSGRENPDGTWTVTVSATAFSNRKADFSALAPSMVSASSNFYPGEAVVVFYSVASHDFGFGGEFVPKVKGAIRDLSGLDMSNRYLFGDNGYFYRRPLARFLTEESMSQLFSDLGF